MKYLETLSVWIALGILFYFLFAIAELSMNAAKWHENMRYGYLALTICAMGVSAFCILITKDKDK